MMDGQFRSQGVPHYRLLTADQIQTIHLSTLELLETVGVRVLNEEAVSLLREAGLWE